MFGPRRLSNTLTTILRSEGDQGSMKKLLLTAIILIPTTVFFTGCQTVPYQGQARDVKKKPQEGGVLALPIDPRDEDRMKADLKMKQNCGKMAIKVLEEGEVVVGQKTNSTATEDNRERTKHKVGSLWGMPITSGDPGGKNVSSSSTTENIKEWQISYECQKSKKM